MLCGDLFLRSGTGVAPFWPLSPVSALVWWLAPCCFPVTPTLSERWCCSILGRCQFFVTRLEKSIEVFGFRQAHVAGALSVNMHGVRILYYCKLMYNVVKKDSSLILCDFNIGRILCFPHPGPLLLLSSQDLYLETVSCVCWREIRGWAVQFDTENVEDDGWCFYIAKASIHLVLESVSVH